MADNRYAQSFGGLSHMTIYSNPCGFEMKSGNMPYGGITNLENMNKAFGEGFGLKALSTQSGGAGTAGYALIPVYVDPQITDLTRKYTPLVAIIPRVSNNGITADYNIITAKGGATTYAEDASLIESTNTYDRKSTSIKYIGIKGRVTGQAMAAVPSYSMAGFVPANGAAVGPFGDQAASNAKQMEVLVAARAMREKEEDLILNGNATTSGSTVGVTGPNGTEFSGIITLMSTTNTVGKSTSALEWDDVETAVKNSFDDGGRPSVAVASSGVVTDLRKLLVDMFHIRPSDVAGGSLSFGIPTAITIYTMVGPVTVIPSMFMSNVSGSKSIYFLDMSVIEMRVLQDMTYKDLPDEDDSEVFMLKIYESLIIKNTAFCSSITAISA